MSPSNSIIVHFVFSTRDQAPVLVDDVRPRLSTFLHEIVAKLGGQCLSTAVLCDHVHVLACIPAHLSPTQVVVRLKSDSAKWLKSQFPELAGIRWQQGSLCVSVSLSLRESHEAYFSKQSELHEKLSFQDEVRSIWRKHDAEIDEPAAWA